MNTDQGRGSRALLRAVLALQAAGAAVYFWLQPGGFTVGSRSFLEHQVLVPTLTGVALGTLLAAWKEPRVLLLGCGILAGFWTFVGGVAFALGNTSFSRGMAAVVAWGILHPFLSRRSHPAVSRRPLWTGTAGGLLLGGAFWTCALAPAPSTRPGGHDLEQRPVAEGPHFLQSPAATVRIHGLDVVVRSSSREARIQLAPDLNAVADTGLWSLFDFRAAQPPPWTVRRVEGDLLELRTECPDFISRALVGLEGKTVRARVATSYPSGVTAHLATALSFWIPGQATVGGIPWNSGDPTEFVAFRRGQLEFLRSRAQEKGPFEILVSWPSEDPVLLVDGWSIQVRGWADQASREESPTAGWGVSQGAIEKWGAMYFWGLATTSMGRVWHTVRIAEGTYSLEVLLTLL